MTYVEDLASQDGPDHALAMREGAAIRPLPGLRYSHGLLRGLTDSEAMDGYVDHPVHRKAQAVIPPLMDDFLIIDGHDPVGSPTARAPTAPGGSPASTTDTRSI